MEDTEIETSSTKEEMLQGAVKEKETQERKEMSILLPELQEVEIKIGDRTYKMRPLSFRRLQKVLSLYGSACDSIEESIEQSQKKISILTTAMGSSFEWKVKIIAEILGESDEEYLLDNLDIWMADKITTTFEKQNQIDIMAKKAIASLSLAGSQV